MESRAQGTDITPWGSINRELLEIVLKGSGKGTFLSMGALLGEPGGRAHLLGAVKVMKGRLWGWVSLFMWAQLGNLEWAHLPGTLR